MMEHELSAYYDITHGHGLAILAPRWLEYILDDGTASAIYRLGIAVFGWKRVFRLKKALAGRSSA